LRFKVALYNRACNSLEYFGYCISSKAHWSKGFEKSDWDKSVQVDNHYIPAWMKDTASTSVAQNPLAEAHVQLSLREIELKWLRNSAGANDEERELDEYLNENEEESGLLVADMDYVGDPRS
jgi:hypothetical protein